MKKVVFTLLLCVIICTTVVAQVSKGASMYISSRTASLKKTNGFFAATAATLSYGDQVTVLRDAGANDKWIEVQSASNSSQRGWMEYAALTSKRIIGGSSTASAGEIALAGKGFNEKFASESNPGGNLNFAEVDRIESIEVKPDGLRKFIADGKLASP
ncbi:MAG: hypothetical protein LBH43_14450 [Treponema sp.]|jgi:hypothetical protein|nr:hypothetical protein [Treponema sp.]